ncbi:bis(5'-nucleosyl)-tetraphosphatase (symmetrical) YqeK [Gorillibacterium massiliense]|uniref:bis(5'-nucleosyl)-tetraphosphatase (symmetrical) YqeK n=1 Tax=Gorillibacterium massiliense TaxID=1280390 RepID=UPI0004B1B770|nr:bis(5'-nucleosyl)-tetraphosphatase (symmetrical) YqeK [Gorillibacterium massiliense]
MQTNKLYSKFAFECRTGDLREDARRFLVNNGHPVTASHCLMVGEEAKRLAVRFGANPQDAEIAGYLHDISAVIPSENRIAAAHELGLPVLTEEESFPMIIHQKLSEAMAHDLFDIENPDILAAIGCHTTLRKRANLLDHVLFVADKIVWDQSGNPPYLAEITQALKLGIQNASYAYLDYLFRHREQMKVVHPWTREAYEDLALSLKL